MRELDPKQHTSMDALSSIASSNTENGDSRNKKQYVRVIIRPKSEEETKRDVDVDVPMWVFRIMEKLKKRDVLDEKHDKREKPQIVVLLELPPPLQRLGEILTVLWKIYKFFF